MIYTAIREMSATDIAKYESALLGETWPLKYPDDDDSVLVMSHDFGDGWEIDVKITKGNPTPFLDVMLFEDGCEVYAWELSEELLGEWTVVMGGNIDAAFRFEIAAEGTVL